MPKEEPMIRVQDVKFRYDPEQPTYAVDGVSLEVRRGEFVAVLGANGCGKSTLAKHFNAILLPETGTVLVENMDTRGEDHLYDIRQKVGMVFQNPDNQIVATIVEEDVAFAPENLGVPAEEIRTRIDEAMKLAGISIVSITHYMEEAAQADRVLVMSRGRIVMEGTPEEVFSQTQRLHSYHLDVPQAAELRDELVKIGIPMPENVITPDRCAEELYKLLQ